MSNIQLKALERKLKGRKVKRLRKEGILPANIFGKKIKSTAIKVPLADFEKVYKEAGETGIIEIVLGKTKRPVLIHNIQTDPVSDIPLHIDFLQIDLKEKVTAQVPVELVGESPAEKQGLGTVVLHLDEIEVEALPKDLPEKFEVGVDKLTEVSQAVFVKDLSFDKKKVEVKTGEDEIVVKVEPLRKEEEEVKPEVEEEVAPGEEVTKEEAEKEGEGGEKTEEAPTDEKKEPQGEEKKESKQINK